MARRSPQLNSTVRAEAERSVLCWLATASADGVPNVTPKEVFAPVGDRHIYIADITSAGSVRNIRYNPNVCVSFIDVFRQKGFKIGGSARIIDPADVDFQEASTPLVKMAGPRFAIRHVISVQILKIERIWAPSYGLDPPPSEMEIMAAAYETYGVDPR